MSTLDPIREILNSLYDCVQNELGPDWKRLKFLENLESNNDMTQNRHFGIRPLEAIEVEGVNKFVTLSQTFELVLVRSKRTMVAGDSDYRELSFDNRRDVLCIYRKIAPTNSAGLGLLVSDLTISEPEFIEDDKVVVQRASFNILYRIQI